MEFRISLSYMTPAQNSIKNRHEVRLVDSVETRSNFAYLASLNAFVSVKCYSY